SPDVLMERIALAPSDPNRIYLAGFVPATADAPRRTFVLRSDDGGARFDAIEIPLEDEERTADVVAVDPTNADRIFVRIRRMDGDLVPERLLYSENGGG